MSCRDIATVVFIILALAAAAMAVYEWRHPRDKS